MTYLLQTYFLNRISFTEVAEEIMKYTKFDWEAGDYWYHIPNKPYDLVFYIGSFMNQDVNRYYRYLWWCNRHVYYGVTEGPPILSPFAMVATKNMRIIVPSNYVKWELEQAGIKVTSVIPHGITSVTSHNTTSDKLWRNVFGDKIVVLYVAHRNIRKGFKYLVEAWKKTRASKRSDVVLLLHTSRQPNINENGYMIPEEGNIVITDNVHKLDKESLYGLYRSVDIYVHAALCEGFGIPIVEAMSAGKPVICLDAPPMNEHVTDRNVLVKVREQVIYNDRGLVNYRLNIPDVNDFAEKLDWLISDEYQRKEIGNRNKELSKRYDSQYVYGQVLQDNLAL